MKSWLGWIVALILAVVLVWLRSQPPLKMEQVEVDADVSFQVSGKWLSATLRFPEEQFDKSGNQHVFTAAKYAKGEVPANRPDRKGAPAPTLQDLSRVKDKADPAKYNWEQEKVWDLNSAPSANSSRWIFVELTCSRNNEKHYACYEWMAPDSGFDHFDFFEVHLRR